MRRQRVATFQLCFWLCVLSICCKAEDGRPCKIHPESDSCKLPAEGVVDVLVACAPCQPYTKLRNGCGVADCRDHPGYSVMFSETGSVISLTGKILPAVFISEQVRGFDKPYDKNSTTSPKTDFVDQVMGIRRRSGALHFSAWACAAMDSKMFVHGSRPRCPKSCFER